MGRTREETSNLLFEKLVQQSDANVGSVEEFWQELDGLDEAEVRKLLALVAYGERKRPLVLEYLRRQEEERKTEAQFGHVLLEPEHTALLSRLVEADRRLPRERREKFLLTHSNAGYGIIHPGWDGGEAYGGDVETLDREGFVAITSHSPSGSSLFDVTPRGFAYYAYLKRRMGQSTERVTTEIRSYLQGDCFRQKYPEAYAKWSSAEDLVWRSDSAGHLTTIGHLCFDARQN